MPQLNSNETYIIRGDMDVSSGTITFRSGQVNRSILVQEDLTEVGIPLNKFVVHNASNTVLPTAAAADDLGYTTGAWSTESPTIQSQDLGGVVGPTTAYARVQQEITNEYVLGETIKLRVRGAMLVVADTTATLDVEVYVNDGDGGVGSELHSAAAQNVNSASYANYDFTIDGSALVAGDTLDCRLTVAISDSGDAAANILFEISRVQLIRDIKG